MTDWLQFEHDLVTRLTEKVDRKIEIVKSSCCVTYQILFGLDLPGHLLSMTSLCT